MIEWNIQSRAHGCQSCARPFVNDEPLHTLLFDERQGYERRDICAACWEAQDGHAAQDRKGFVSHWQGVYVAPVAVPEAITRDTAESLLRRLAELNDPQHAAACFILAAMLERKRLLKVKDQLFHDGRRVFVYEHVKSGDVLTIPDPNLQLDQLEEVQRSVAHLLQHGLTPEGAGVSAPMAGATPAPGAAVPEPAPSQPAMP